ncbi:hypothetical protein [Methylosinus sp. LW4]|uniref:hyaluronate lyase N-terminal domain-containing protein n=1 Tax=Methylosinus sp. LW4 TaxID=136993 RepID=UPI00037B5BFD|nr:hypothetical protein [Methylosinus sp. LW4]
MTAEIKHRRGDATQLAAFTPAAGEIVVDTTNNRAVVGDGSRAGGYPAARLDESGVGFRNRLRNAAFSINQRGVSGTVTLSAGAYGHDGVKAGAAGCSYTFATSGIDTTITVASGSLILPIEGALIEGGNYMLSHAGTAQARIWQTSPAGSYVSVAGGLIASGLTANTLTAVEFSTGTILRPQFEPGVYATAFERRPLGVELALCQRYFQSRLASHLALATAATQFFGGAIALPVTMRATPTLSSLSGGTQTNVASDGLNTMGDSAVRYYISSTAAGEVESYDRAFTASAEL